MRASADADVAASVAAARKPSALDGPACYWRKMLACWPEALSLALLVLEGWLDSLDLIPWYCCLQAWSLQRKRTELTSPGHAGLSDSAWPSQLAHFPSKAGSRSLQIASTSTPISLTDDL